MLKQQPKISSLSLVNNNFEILSFDNLSLNCKKVEIQQNKVHLQLPGDYDEVKICNCTVLSLDKVYSAQIDFSNSDLQQFNINNLRTDRLIIQHCNIDRLPNFEERVPIYIDASHNNIQSLDGIDFGIRTLICQFNKIKSLKPLKARYMCKIDMKGNKISSLKYL